MVKTHERVLYLITPKQTEEVDRDIWREPLATPSSHAHAKTDDTSRGGASSPLTTTKVAKVTRQTNVGVVAQKNTHHASTYLSVLRADTWFSHHAVDNMWRVRRSVAMFVTEY